MAYCAKVLKLCYAVSMGDALYVLREFPKQNFFI